MKRRRPYNDGLDSHYQLRLRIEDRDRWEAAAERDGIELAQWIRMTLNKAAMTQ